MSRRTIFALLFTLAALVDAHAARAANTTLLSSLGTLPATKEGSEPENEKAGGVPGIAVKEARTTPHPLLELTAATTQGYCLADRETPTQLQSSWMTSTRTDTAELWRLVEKDGTATLERTRLGVEPAVKKVWPTSRTSVALRAVARADGVAVWAYRDRTGNVVLLARNAKSGREVRPNTEGTGFVSSECGWGSVRLAVASAKAGVVAQLGGTLPPVGEGKDKTTPRFAVNASLAKVARDPEPVLAVRVRRLD